MEQAKRYPISARKHAHDIEFRRNRTFNIMHDMELAPDMDVKEYERLYDVHDALTDLLRAVIDTQDSKGVAWLYGPQISLAKETVLWAGVERGHRMNHEPYTSSTSGDYSPSSPWNAPGMSAKDFI